MNASEGLKRVLVTGANGFIGSHCLSPLLQRNYEVHAISRQIGMESESSVIWHQADLLKSSACEHLMKMVKPTHLLHLAWYVVPGKLFSSDLNFDCVRSSMELLRAFEQHGGKRVVMSGSSCEYDWTYGYCHETRTPTVSNSIYGTCKHALSLLAQAFCRTHGISHAWPRIFFLYGPNEHPDRLVSSVVRSLLLGQEARCSYGGQIRDYLYVQDAAEAIVSILDSGLEGAVNVGSGTAVTLREMVLHIGRSLGSEDLIKLGAVPASLNDAPLVVADVERLTNEVKWQPRVSIEQGLKNTIEWWRQELVKER